ncbi:hypothetical protein GQX74_013013 [Glossina fuscipes]|nr:hypothetical protein GQX74_013013 [Glossina fuscipes]
MTMIFLVSSKERFCRMLMVMLSMMVMMMMIEGSCSCCRRKCSSCVMMWPPPSPGSGVRPNCRDIVGVVKSARQRDGWGLGEGWNIYDDYVAKRIKSIFDSNSDESKYLLPRIYMYKHAHTSNPNSIII